MNLNNVTFKNTDSSKGTVVDMASWNFILLTKSISSPTMQTHKVNVPLKNGTLDLQSYLSSYPKYNDRTIVMEFADIYKKIPYKDASKQVGILSSVLCAGEYFISFSEYSQFSYVGNVSSVEWEWDNSFLKITVTATVKPYQVIFENKNFNNYNLGNLNGGDPFKYCHYSFTGTKTLDIGYAVQSGTASMSIHIYNRPDSGSIVDVLKFDSDTSVARTLYRGDSRTFTRDVAGAHTLQLSATGDAIVDVIVGGML